MTLKLFIARLLTVVLSAGESFVAGPFFMRLSAVNFFVIRALFVQIFAIRHHVVIILSRIFSVRLFNAILPQSSFKNFQPSDFHRSDLIKFAPYFSSDFLLNVSYVICLT